MDTLLSVSAALPAQAQDAAPAPAPAAARFPFELHLSEGERHDPGPEVPEYDIGWGDVLDIINPLQHIPILSSLYRSLTGDEISGPAQVLGSTLFGGPIGMIAGVANAIAAEASGAALGDTLVAKLLGTETPGAADEGGTLLAAADPPDPAPAPTTDTATDTSDDGGGTNLASAFAPVVAAPGQALTGDAALSALMGDLRRADSRPRPDGVTPAPTTAVTSEPLAPSGEMSAEVPGMAPAGAPGAVPVSAFAKQMMLGLDKYRAMALERGGPGHPALPALDQSL